MRGPGSEESSEEEEEEEGEPGAEDEEVCDQRDAPSSHSSRISKVQRRGIVFGGRRGRKAEASLSTEICPQVRPFRQDLALFARTKSQAGEHVLQLRRGMQWLRIRKRLSRKGSKRLRNDGSKATIWSQTRSNVNSWKVRLTRLLLLLRLLKLYILILEEKEAEIPDVDDTDGLDPEAEFEAWRLRELARIKRDKEAEVQRELEREEIERRRALPEEQRLKEDMENAKRTRDEKPKGQQKFLQKYWHKGAFHQASYPFSQLPCMRGCSCAFTCRMQKS